MKYQITPADTNKLREIPLNEQIGIEIKKRRKQLRLTQEQLAEIAGTSQTVIFRIESGKSNATIELVDRILLSMGRRSYFRMLPALSGESVEVTHTEIED